MTDKETLLTYRLKQADETLKEAKKMLAGGYSTRTIINRAYYSLFYAVLALYIKTGVPTKTSKHSGIISIFDGEFVKTGKIEKSYSKILHDLFDARQEGDYKEFVEPTREDAADLVNRAEDFIRRIKETIS